MHYAHIALSAIAANDLLMPDYAASMSVWISESIALTVNLRHESCFFFKLDEAELFSHFTIE